VTRVTGVASGVLVAGFWNHVGRAISSRSARPARSGCSPRPGDDPAAGAGRDHRPLRRRAADRAAAAGRGAPPAAGRPHPAAGPAARASRPEEPGPPHPRPPALVTLPEAAGSACWRTRSTARTYRQAERTFGLVAGALARDIPDGLGGCFWARSARTGCSDGFRVRVCPCRYHVLTPHGVVSYQIAGRHRGVGHLRHHCSRWAQTASRARGPRTGPAAPLVRP